MNIDTLSIARELKAAELPAAQAEAIAAAIGRSLSEGSASKTDVETIAHRIDALERALESKFDSLESRLSSKIDNARSSLLTWLMGVIVATAGVLIAVIRL